MNLPVASHTVAEDGTLAFVSLFNTVGVRAPEYQRKSDHWKTDEARRQIFSANETAHQTNGKYVPILG